MKVVDATVDKMVTFIIAKFAKRPFQLKLTLLSYNKTIPGIKSWSKSTARIATKVNHPSRLVVFYS